MSTDNIDLEEMVEKTLESTGILSKMRAELRANVFCVLEKGSSFQNKLCTGKINDFVSNKNGPLLLSLVKDLFDYLDLTFTTSVFDPETGAGHHYQYTDKDNIFEELSLSRDDKRPLLMQVLEMYQSHSKSADNLKNYKTQYDGNTYEGSALAHILKSNAEELEKTEPDDTPRCSSPVKINLAEQNIQYNSFAANSGSLLASNCNLSDNSKLKDVESCESLNSSSKSDNTDEDVKDIKSDIKNNKNESSLEDIETDENVSCGNDSLPSTDLSFQTQNDSPEMIKPRNINI